MEVKQLYYLGDSLWRGESSQSLLHPVLAGTQQSFEIGYPYFLLIDEWGAIVCSVPAFEKTQ